MPRLTPYEFQSRNCAVEGQWCMLHGSDDYRKQEALEGLLRGLASASEGLFQPLMLDAAGLTAMRLLASAQTPSIFGPSVTVVRSIQQMHADEQQVLASGLERIAPDALVVLVSSTEEGRGPHSALLRAVDKVGTAVAFEEPKHQEARRWVREQAELLGAAIQPRAAALLVERVGMNLVQLRQELEKLTLFSSDQRNITADHVEALTARRLDEQVFHMVDAIGGGQVDRALLILQDLLARSSDRSQSARVVGAASHHFRMVWHTKRLLEAGWRPERSGLTEEQAALVSAEAAGTLKVSWRAKKLTAQAQRFSWARLVSALENLAQCDLALKAGADVKLRLEKLVISLSTPPQTR